MELHTSLKNISRLKTRLWIDGHAKDLSALGEFSALKELWLYRLSKRNILVLAAVDLSKLDTLSVRLASFPDLTGISHFSTTTSLTVWQCSNLRSLEGLESLANLRELTLMQNGPLDSLGPIASLGHLEKLVINGGVFAKQSLVSFEPLARPGRRYKLLDLSGVKLENPDLRPLSRLPEPDEFGISARFYPLEQVALLAAAFPKWGQQLMNLQDNPYSKCKMCGGSKKDLVQIPLKRSLSSVRCIKDREVSGRLSVAG